MSALRWITWTLAGVIACGCSRPSVLPTERTSLSAAYCQVPVAEYGVVEVESDYLPRVVQCENGNADIEALKALAIAARSYLYYKLDREGVIVDSPQDQVYSCTRPPSMRVHAAVRATSGLVLRYGQTQVAGFYVAGAKWSPPMCSSDSAGNGRLADLDPTNTERYVTYNAGRSGHDVVQTSLGFVDPRNRANRGCKSQNGAACLARDGWRYDEIVRFYYGDDIEIVQANGPCILPLPVASPHAGLVIPAWSAMVALLIAMTVGWLVIIRVGVRAPKARRRKRAQA